MTIAEKLTAVAENTPKVFEAGQKAQQERFWEILQQGGNRTTYKHAFYAPGTQVDSPVWTDENFKPIYPIICKQGNAGDYMLTSSGVTEINVPIVAYNLGANQSEYMFWNNPKLKKISHIEVKEGATFTNWFTGCTALENITMSGVISENISFADCPLTNASVQTVIQCLKDLTGADARTLTLSPLTGGALTQAQRAAIAAKNWNLVY